MDNSFNPKQLEEMEQVAIKNMPQEHVTIKKPAIIPSVFTSNTEDSISPYDDVSQDLLFKHLFLMQNSSSFVKEGGDIQGGDIVTDEEEVVAKKGEELLFLPLFYKKFWQVMDTSKNPPEVIKAIDYKGNENLSRLQVYDDGTKIENKLVFNFYVLLLDDVEEDLILPYNLRMKGSNVLTAKKIVSDLMIYRAAKKPLIASLKSEYVQKPIGNTIAKFFSYKYKKSNAKISINEEQKKSLSFALSAAKAAAQAETNYTSEKNYEKLEGEVPSRF